MEKQVFKKIDSKLLQTVVTVVAKSRHDFSFEQIAQILQELSKCEIIKEEEEKKENNN